MVASVGRPHNRSAGTLGPRVSQMPEINDSVDDGGTPDRYGALLREAAHRLADTAASYGVLNIERLAALSGSARWPTVGFAEALAWAVDNDILRRLGSDLYEVPRNVR